jgi:hypothetical protein
MTIVIGDNSPRQTYTATAGQTDFPTDFAFFAKADVNVYVNGTLKTLDSDYSIPTTGPSAWTSGNDGTIVFTTGLSAGDTVVLTRDVELERTTDFPSSGPFQVATLNTELDKIVAMIADLEDLASRGITLADSDTGTTASLPNVNDRKGRVLAFENDSTAAPKAGPLITDVQTVANVSADIATLADIEDGTVATDAISDLASITSEITTNANNLTAIQNASTNATTASTKAAEAAASASAAATSETNAATSETNSATSETNAASSASSASTNASSAATSAASATSSASAASSSAASAASAQTAAESARDSALSAYDNFDDRYLGVKSSNPSTDNDGDALVAGTIYFNSTTEKFLVYTGSAWADAYADGTTLVAKAGDTMTGDLNVPNLSASGEVDANLLTVDSTGNALLDMKPGTSTAANYVNFHDETETVKGYLGYLNFDDSIRLHNNGNTVSFYSSGNVNFPGNVTIDGTGTFDGRDLSVDGAKLDGIEAGATADQDAAEIRALVESATDSNVFTDADHTKLNGIETGATADQSASEILTAVKTVDGAASGLDADLLDGVQGSSYLRSDTDDTFAADLTISGSSNSNIDFTPGNSTAGNYLNFNDDTGTLRGYFAFWNFDDSYRWVNSSSGSTKAIAFYSNGDVSFDGGLTTNDGGSNQTIWHAGNDGSGSGLDADLLDGINSSQFLRSDTNDTLTGTLTLNSGSNQIYLGSDGAIEITRAAGGAYIDFKDSTSEDYDARVQLSGTDLNLNGSKIWTAGNDGASSGLDADLLDGQHGSYYLDYNNLTNTPTTSSNADTLDNLDSTQFLRSDTDDTFAADLTIAGSSNSNIDFTPGSSTGSNNLNFNDDTGTQQGYFAFWNFDNSYRWVNSSSGSTKAIAFYTNGNVSFDGALTTNNGGSNQTIWHAGNDGSGSGLDADTVDGIQASSFLRSDANDSASGNLTFSGQITSSRTTNNYFGIETSNTSEAMIKYDNTASDSWYVGLRSSSSNGLGAADYHVYSSNVTQTVFGVTASGTAISKNQGTLWGSSNDGAGSGLDADLLDGQQPSSLSVSQANQITGNAFATTGSPGSVLEYQQAASQSDTKLAPSTDWHNTIRMGHGNPYSYYSNTLAMRMTGTGAGTIFTQLISNNSAQGWRQVWDSGNDGSGSGLDADLLDGQQGSYYLDYNNLSNKPTIASSNNPTFTGKVTNTTHQNSATTPAFAMKNDSGDTSYDTGMFSPDIYLANSVGFAVDGDEAFVVADGYYNNVRGGADNKYNLGLSSYRWKDVWAVDTSINSSDENLKQQISSLTDAEITAAKAISKLFKTYKWNDSVEEKGDDARTHTGLIAQQVKQAMENAGLDATKYAFWCSDTWWEKEIEQPTPEGGEPRFTKKVWPTEDVAPEGAVKKTLLSLRYAELMSFVGAATEQRLTNIETRLAALEN